MDTESKYEKLYNDLVDGLEQMHQRNVKRTSDALKSLLIIPTIFLILLFLTKTSKTIFLVLWIASMFVIAAVLIIVEYQDYLLRKMFSVVDTDNEDDTEPEETVEAASDTDEALMRAGLILDSVQHRAPEFDTSEETPAKDFEYDNPEEAPAAADEADAGNESEVNANS